MDNKMNLNASGYIPKNKRDDYSYHQGNTGGYSEYDNYSYYQNYNQGNKDQYRDNRSYQNYGDSQNYYQGNKDQYQDNKSYHNYGDSQNYYQEEKYNQGQGYKKYKNKNPKYTKEAYNNSGYQQQNDYGHGGNTYYEQSQSNYYKGNKSQGNYDQNYNKYYKQGNYNQGQYVEYEQKYDSQYNNNNNNTYKSNANDRSNKYKSQVVSENVSVSTAYKQDYEDDYINPNELAYDDFEGDELEGDFIDEGEYVDEFQEGNNSDNLEDEFSSMNINSKSKNPLTFDNKFGFTDLVDDMIREEYKKRNNQIFDNLVNVLMIAEKPSIARSISAALSGGKMNSKKFGKGGVIITFDGYFQNVRAKFTVSSVMGHVYTSDFKSEHNKWDAIDFLDLYDAPVVKLDSQKKSRMPYTLQKLATKKDIVCLWLDCDKEGENICYEVLYNVYKRMTKKKYQQVYRAKFSSLTNEDLKKAYNNMQYLPNRNESSAVDSRQVIDLKIGVSFTRFLTSSILPGIKGLDTNLLSYGPCQTPTLWFCVNRQNEIEKFRSKEYFNIYTELEINRIKYKITHHSKIWDKQELKILLAKLKDAETAKVVEVLTEAKSKPPPVGLNTVQMLRTASSFLKMSPHETMHVAEKLYTMGYITYPRTETTKYAGSFDFMKSLKDFSTHPTFGKQITQMLKNYKRPVLRGVDVGDHPPITPSKVAQPGDLKGEQWQLYEFICSNYFASLDSSAEYEEKVFKIEINGEIFQASSLLINNEGFLKFMPWKKKNYVKDFPVLKKDQTFPVAAINSVSNWTEPPGYLTESDLIKMMEHNKIGTDASMPVHIENICQRKYVRVDDNRRLIPTKLGKALIESLSQVDPDIVQPTVRAEIEGLVDQLAKGKKRYDEIIHYAMELYKKKFLLVRTNYEKILTAFKKYFDIDLSGMNKIYQDIRSKNEDFKIKNQVRKSANEVNTDLNICDQCKKGKMYIEFDSIDKNLLLCTSCKRRNKVLRDSVKVDVLKSLKCQKCSSYYVEVELENPFLSGEKTYTGCMFCDPNLR